MARREDQTPAAPDAEPTTPQTSGDEGVIANSPDAEPPTDVTPADEPQSMMDAVEKAIGKSSDPDSSETEAGPDGEGDAQSPEGKADGEADSAKKDGEEDLDTSFLKEDPTQEEVGKYSRKAQARIRDLIDQRNRANEQVQIVAPILDYLQRNDIPQQDLDVILDLTARLRHGDFAGFLEGVRPYVNLAMQYTGQTLPPDLQKQVREGYVSPEIARELAQRRANERVMQSRHQTETRQTQQQLTQTRAQAIRQTVTNWEQQTRAKDPDYGLKADVVRRTAQALMQEHGVPQTPEQALEYVNMAYQEVNEQMKRLRPAPKATAPVPSSTSSARGSTAPSSEPKSMFEAAMQGLNAHRAGASR